MRFICIRRYVLRRMILVFIAFTLIVSLSKEAHSDAIWKQVKGIKEASIKEVFCDKEAGAVYVASEKIVYKPQRSSKFHSNRSTFFHS